MKRVRLAHFTKGDDEYVVIITDDSDVSEFQEPGYSVSAVMVADVDAKAINSFPCDRVLRPE